MANQVFAWRKVALAILPGVFALGLELNLERYLGMDDSLPVWILGFLCLVLCIVGFAQEHSLAVWSSPALGISLIYFASLIVMLFDTKGLGWWQTLVFVVFYGLAPMLIGLLLARRAGILAGLVFIGAAYMVWESIGDPEYALLMYTGDKALVAFVSICPQLFFLIVVPVVVMRLSSTVGRIIGYLAPVTVALVAAAGIGSTIRPYSSFIWIVSIDFAFIVLPLILMLGICTLIEKKTLALKLVS